jgi:hypothetical protein
MNFVELVKLLTVLIDKHNDEEVNIKVNAVSGVFNVTSVRADSTKFVLRNGIAPYKKALALSEVDLQGVLKTLPEVGTHQYGNLIIKVEL